jgi:hypothetical protein
VPFHFGITDFPESYAGERQRPSETFYDLMLNDPTQVEEPEAFWLFKSIGAYINDNRRAGLIRARALQTERRLRSTQKELESHFASIKTRPGVLGGVLSDFSTESSRQALDILRSDVEPTKR